MRMPVMLMRLRTARLTAQLAHGLPHGENRTSGLTTSNLSRFHVNLTPANILTASFLFNLADTNRYGLSILNPLETTTNIRADTYMSTIRDQHYFSGKLMDVGFADSRGATNDPVLAGSRRCGHPGISPGAAEGQTGPEVFDRSGGYSPRRTAGH